MAAAAFGPNAAAEGPRVRLETNLGAIVLELDAERAPRSAENFLGYVRDGFYDGTVFHRVIKDFMIQGGGLTAGLDRKQTRDPIENEATNGLRNTRGTVAMARTSAPHSATSQFFINVVDNAFLDHKAPSGQGWGYAVFGRVVEGMDTVDRIRAVETGSSGPYRDVPRAPVVIERAVEVKTDGG
ncbi:MAG: peptidyl-prolyl cis-trans isomerase [Chromatiales bacterium]|nr:peptidyl-prolyl cis-trans isomerase [Chromatiales bacterium]